MTAYFRTSKIRALVVDDSLFTGMQIAEILNEDEDVEVIGRASNGLEALKMVEELQPDVITMAVEMPNMDGITALKHIMVKNPVPTVMISSFAEEATETTFDAFRYGAVDVIAKPSLKQTVRLEAERRCIVSRVKRAAAVKAERCRYRRTKSPPVETKKSSGGPPDSSTRYVCVCAVTNGYYCLLGMIPNLQVGFDHVIIATIPAAPRQVEVFVNYLDAHSDVPVKNLRTNRILEKGTCYLCSGNDGLVLRDDGNSGLRVHFNDPEHHKDPASAIDRVMTALAHVAGDRAVGLVIGIGGHEGVAGVEEIRRRGGIGIVKDMTACRRDGRTFRRLLDGREARGMSVAEGRETIQCTPAPPESWNREDFGVSEGQIEELSAGRDSLSEFVNGVDIIDYLQFVLLSGKSVVLEVLSDAGVTGEIYVRGGSVLHAHCGDLQGDQALYQCLASRGGSFLNRPWHEPAKVSIDRPGELVLMEAARRRDEAQCEWLRLVH
jgi:two-component system chemotaxis response regulator CheB